MEDTVEKETNRMLKMLERMKSVLTAISEEQVQRYCRDMLVTDSFIGQEAKKAILKKLAMEHKALYRTASDKAYVDGYIGDHAIIIKPYERQHDDMIDELTHVYTVYYKLHDSDIELLYDFQDAS